MQNRNIFVYDRFKILAEKYGFNFEFSNTELYDLYMSLERLDNSWEIELEKLKTTDCDTIFKREDLHILFEQLACYFIFRHFKYGVGFTLLSCWVLGALFSDCETTDEMLDVARMYSSEIEYSEENIEKIRDFLNDKGGSL